MKKTVKVFSITGIVMGGLAILSCLETPDVYAFIGGAWFVAWGIIDLIFINSLEENQKIKKILYCSECGVKNSADSIYCEKCGKKIVPEIPKTEE